METPDPYYVTIHGHFYQPPRENPWLEAVETQDSAHPYHDWNERITAECYAANATARILDARDRIRKIVNNYASISFNFGPTLLSWLATAAPETYEAILDADRTSRERFSGHGSAIAQAYNHVILPLANERDKRTQVRWGIRDFEARFHRKPEGMWLPETAVDVASLEALAAEGIRFTILEPQQAARHRPLGSAEWRTGSVDTTKPYRCILPSGRSLDIFFYEGPISRAVAFEQLLARGEYFASRLTGRIDRTSKRPQNVNIATDGETYGHHHRYGEMALAYAIEVIEQQRLGRLTNYGEHLARHPPEDQVEIADRTSWSCAHGVERWQSDCGCNAGAPSGWHQRWRGPLRGALDWLRDQTVVIFEEKRDSPFNDPWGARDDYIDVVLDRSDQTLRRFLRKHAVTDASATRALEMLEMQRNAMLMFTSCGWFFNEVSGIETVQVLAYAARVLQLAEKVSGRSIESDFLERLTRAESNLADRVNARVIFEREVLSMRLDLSRVAAHYAVASLFDAFEDDARVYCYQVTRKDFDIFRAGRARMAVGSITVTSTITQETSDYEFAVLHLGETELTGGVRPARSEGYESVKQLLNDTFEPGGIPAVIRLLDRHFTAVPLSIRSLFRDEQRRILNLICNATLEEAESAFRQLHQKYDPLMRFHARLGIPLPKVLQTAAEFDTNTQVRRLLEGNDPPLAELESLLREATEERVPLDGATTMSLSNALDRAARRFADHPEDIDSLESYSALVALIREMDIPVDLRAPQDTYYRMQSLVRPAFAASSSNGEVSRWITLFDDLGEKLAMSPEARG